MFLQKTTTHHLMGAIVAPIFLTIVGSNANAVTLFVDDDAPLNGDGQSWNTAFQTIQAAYASFGPLGPQGLNTINVAQGIYIPTDQQQGFVLFKDVKMFGGFAGLSNPANPDERDPFQFLTILEGDVLGNDVPGCVGGPFGDCFTDNINTIVTANDDGMDSFNTKFDGFTIRHASGSTQGGGMKISNGADLLVNRCVFEFNKADEGAGLFVDGASPEIRRCGFFNNSADLGGGAASSTGQPKFLTCVFQNNQATIAGGGLKISVKSFFAEVTSCIFLSNSAGNGIGGGMDLSGGDFLGRVNVTNCLITFNSAGSGGGASVSVSLPEARFLNCTIANNSATGGGGGILFSNNSAIRELRNSIVYFNTGSLGSQVAITQCSGSFFIDSNDIQFGQPGISGGCTMAYTNNIDIDPSFVNPVATTSANYRVACGSPCIDMGNASVGGACNGYPCDVLDIDGDGITNEPIPDLSQSERIIGVSGATIDIGAYEARGGACSSDCAGGAFGPDGTVNVTDLLFVLGSWGSVSGADVSPSCSGDGLVGVGDLLQVLADWGCSAGQGGGGAPPMTVQKCMQIYSITQEQYDCICTMCESGVIDPSECPAECLPQP